MRKCTELSCKNLVRAYFLQSVMILLLKIAQILRIFFFFSGVDESKTKTHASSLALERGMR